MQLNKIKNIIKNNLPTIQKQYNVEEIGIFGSYAQNQQKEGSDIDILVNFYKPISLFKFVDLKEFLEKKLNNEVDLVSKKGIKPIIKKSILNEVVYI